MSLSTLKRRATNVLKKRSAFVLSNKNNKKTKTDPVLLSITGSVLVSGEDYTQKIQ